MIDSCSTTTALDHPAACAITSDPHATCGLGLAVRYAFLVHPTPFIGQSTGVCQRTTASALAARPSRITRSCKGTQGQLSESASTFGQSRNAKSQIPARLTIGTNATNTHQRENPALCSTWQFIQTMKANKTNKPNKPNKKIVDSEPIFIAGFLPTECSRCSCPLPASARMPK